MRKNTAKLLMVLALLGMSLTTGATTARAGEERREHPRISRAITALQAAIAELRAAPHDFGGHRADAVQACENAVSQLRQALAYRSGAEGHGH